MDDSRALGPDAIPKPHGEVQDVSAVARPARAHRDGQPLVATLTTAAFGAHHG